MKLEELKSKLREEEGHLRMTPQSLERVQKEAYVEGLREALRIIEDGEVPTREG